MHKNMNKHTQTFLILELIIVISTDPLEGMGQAKFHSNGNNSTQYVGWKGGHFLQIPCGQFH